MKLTINDTGYVGLVSGTCFAEVGHHVICVDNDANKVKMLQGGGIPIYEPGLEELVKKNIAAGRLKFTNSTAEGVQNSDVVFIAVPTPTRIPSPSNAASPTGGLSCAVTRPTAKRASAPFISCATRAIFPLP